MLAVDLFSVPLGYVDPDQGPDDELSISPIPPEVVDYPGKWLALHAGRILAVRDTRQELRDEFTTRRADVSFFHVPTTRIFAR